MIEAEWMLGDNPNLMMRFVRDKVSDRKLRLFVVACARNRLPPSPDEDVIEALAVAEQFADGIGSLYTLARVRKSLKKNHRDRVTNHQVVDAL